MLRLRMVSKASVGGKKRHFWFVKLTHWIWSLGNLRAILFLTNTLSDALHSFIVAWSTDFELLFLRVLSLFYILVKTYLRLEVTY